MSKPFWKSKTVWFNVVTAVAHYAGYLPAKYAVTTVAVANVLLRFLTAGPVTFGGE